MIRPGMISGLIERELQAGSWLLDPFGSHPGADLECARQGFPVMVASNNPILAFTLKVLAANHSAELAQSAIAALANSRKGSESIEAHLKSLYDTECPRCASMIQADSYVWKKGERLPISRSLRCPECGTNGEFSITQTDENSLRKTGNDALHRSRAVDRILTPGDPIEPAVRELLNFYQPRPLYFLFTFINRIEMLDLSPEQREILTAIALSLCDMASSLWPHPAARSRPRQLSPPGQYREFNLWKVVEESPQLWCQRLNQAIEFTRWPTLPSGAGICLFPSRIRDLMPLEDEVHFKGVAAVFPRPNQALWTLSAVWSGWLWGRQAVAPLRNALDRKRYDWAWHSAALEQAVTAISRNAADGLPIIALVPEISAGLGLSIFSALQKANLELTGLAYSEAEEILQLTGKFTRAARKVGPALEQLFPDAVEDELSARGMPARYPTLLIGALSRALAENCPLVAAPSLSKNPPTDSLYQRLGRLISNPSRFQRLGSQAAEIDSGWWWLRHPSEPPEESLDEKIEVAVVRALQNNPEIAEKQLFEELCVQFPGTLTPDPQWIQAVLQSYGTPLPNGHWTLARQEQPKQRIQDLEDIRKILKSLAEHLNIKVEILPPRIPNSHEGVLWRARDNEPVFLFYISASGKILADLLQPQPLPVDRCITVIPGSRAHLIALRLTRDPRLSQLMDQGWRFLKFRHLRLLADQKDLSIETFHQALSKDPPAPQDNGQLSLF